MKTMKAIAAVLFMVAGSAQAADQGTVLVTGANRGIGLEFVKQYAAKGYKVIATARRPDDATDLQAMAKADKDIVIEAGRERSGRH